MNQRKISVRAAHEAIGSRGELYEIMHRNLHYIPSERSSIIGIRYMKDVAAGKLWAPTYDSVRMAPWRRRLPARSEIIRELNQLAGAARPVLALGIVRGKKEPDRKWMLNCLRTLAPEHYFFDKAFVPQLVREDESSSESDVVSDIPMSFFEDLPVQNGKRK